MEHRDIQKGQIHVIHNFEFADIAERDAYIPSIEDLKKVCLVNSPFSYYALRAINPAIWEAFGAGTTNNQMLQSEITKSNTNPSTNTNPTELGTLWVNYTAREIFICTDITTDKNKWDGSKGTLIELDSIWTPPTKGSVIHQNFTTEATRISDQEYTQFDMTIKTNTLAVSGYEIYKAFDGLTAWGDGTWVTSWSAETVPLPNWIEIKTKEKRLASSFKFMQPYNGANCISELIIQGSNDGISFTDLATMKPTQTYNVYQTVNIENPNYYKIYRVKITKKYGIGIGSASMQFIY